MSSGVKDIQLLELKDTILQLNNTIREQSSLIENLQKLLEERNAADAKKDQIISNLEAQLEFLKQKLFGSTSESRRAQYPGQMSIFDLLDGEEEKPAVEIEPEIIEVKAYKKERKPKATYDEMFADLPTTQIRVDSLTEEQKTCSVCGTQMVPIGHEVIRTEINVKDEGVPALIPGSYVSSGLAAHVMYAKYVLGMPLYRLEKDFVRLGARISRTTMASWIIYCSENYLQPVYQYLHRLLLKRRYLMADETPIQVLRANLMSGLYVPAMMERFQSSSTITLPPGQEKMPRHS